MWIPREFMIYCCLDMSEKAEQSKQDIFLPHIITAGKYVVCQKRRSRSSKACFSHTLLLQVNITVKTNYIHFLKRELKFNWILRLP